MKRLIKLFVIVCACSILMGFNFAVGNQRIGVYINAHNDSNLVEWSLKSALNQQYHNYYIVLFNADGCNETISAHPKGDLVQCMHFEANSSPCENYTTAIQKCAHPEDVIVLLEGDCALADDHVLSSLNRIYSQFGRNIWLTYGQSANRVTGAADTHRPYSPAVINHNAFREIHDNSTHLNTFKAWLFNRVCDKDLRVDENYYTSAWEDALILPMLEMAAHHHHFCEKILVVRNPDEHNDLSMIKKARLTIRAKEKYQPLYHRPDQWCLRNECAMCQEKFQ